MSKVCFAVDAKGLVGMLERSSWLCERAYFRRKSRRDMQRESQLHFRDVALVLAQPKCLLSKQLQPRNSITPSCTSSSPLHVQQVTRWYIVIELSHLHAEVYHGAWLVMLAMSSRQINTTAPLLPSPRCTRCAWSMCTCLKLTMSRTRR
jgi:hypothetical protein